MTDVRRRIAELSPDERAILEERLLAASATRSPAPSSIPRRDPGGPSPLSYAQQRLWFLDRLEPDEPTYNTNTAFRLRGPLDVTALRHALDAVVARHEVLRTTFVTTDGVPLQAVAPTRSADFAVDDLRESPGEPADEALLHRRLRDESRRPFDLARDVMLRARLFRLGDGDHVLLLTVHHIATDGWSGGVLAHELSELYAAVVGGRAPDLPPLPIQYADYALWQRRSLEGDVLDAELAHWRQRLAGVPALLALPADRPRPAVLGGEAGAEAVRLPRSASDALKTLGRQARVTPFMVLLAGFKALLGRYTGREDIVVGAPIAGRTRVETERLVGFFVNTLVLRTDLSGDPSFRELLGRVREVCLEAYAHQHLPFEKLVEELRPERSRSHAPLIQILFAFQNAPGAPLQLPGLAVTPVEVEPSTAKFDLVLDLRERDGEFTGRLTYAAALFDGPTIARMAGHLQTLLEGAVADPDRPLSRLPLLTEPERHQLLVEWNRTARPYPLDQGLHELVEAQACRTPDAVAVELGERRLTYQELDRQASALAAHLAARGIGRGDRVGVALERSPELIVAILAVLKAGAAYTPLDPDYPPERLAFVLRDAAVAALLTQPRLETTLPAPAGVVLRLEPGRPVPAPERAAPALAAVDPDSIAYVIYTSGSTGRPKGTLNTHRGIVNQILWTLEAFPLSPADRVLQKTPIGFDVAVWEIFWPLAAGACLVLARPGGHLDPDYLVTHIRQAGLTVLHFVPSMLRLFLDHPDVEACRSLRQILCSGEALPYPLAERVAARLPHARLANLYGPAETAVHVTAWRCRPDEPTRTVPIGHPVANTRVYVLDPHGQPVPAGIPGELHLGGVQVGPGYLDRPELTTQRFVPDPFAPGPGARLYRTGDRARFRLDGALEFLGRLDFQVKIRGVRIEPGEVEARLAEHPAVREVVVVARVVDDATRLVAYVVPHDHAPDAATLRAFLRRTLPEPMIPETFIPLDRIPLGPNGKVALEALPTPRPATPPREAAEPRTAEEQELAKIWRHLLRHDKISVDADFFDLGGHSLLVTQLLARIERTFGRPLPVAAIFAAPTIRTLAALLTGEPGLEVPRVAPIQPSGFRAPLFFVEVYPLFRRLAGLLGTDRPFLGLAIPDATELSHPFDMREIASRLVSVIRAERPSGPYLIGGWSAGATAAYEVARQLHAAGSEVSLLAMVDGPSPDIGRRPPEGSGGIGLRRRVSLHLGHLRTLPSGMVLRYLRSRAEAFATHVQAMAWRAAYRLALERGHRFLPRFRQSERILEFAAMRYRPEPYPGRLVYFRSASRLTGTETELDKGWCRLADGGAEVHVIPGDHITMFTQQNVEVLAAALRGHLEGLG
jgi:amino acid adenylation domain-containing protein